MLNVEIIFVKLLQDGAAYNDYLLLLFLLNLNDVKI